MIPYSIEQLQDIYSPGVMQETTGHGWVWAVSEPYAPYPWERLRAAWWVLTGKATAMVRPRPGELEAVLDIVHERGWSSARSPRDANSAMSVSVPAQSSPQEPAQRELSGIQEGPKR